MQYRLELTPPNVCSAGVRVGRRKRNVRSLASAHYLHGRQRELSIRFIMLVVVDHQYAGLDSLHGPPLCSRATVGDMQEEEGASGVVVNAQDDISDLDSVVEIQVDKTASEAAEAKSNQISSASSSKKRRFHRPDLRTIRESPETIYTVSYIDMDEAAEAIEKEGIIVPEPELATPGMTVLEIAQETIEPPNEEGQENGCKITQSHLL